ncbi:MAG TPA: tetratricopeptide repeat protein, partial [Patescibacteria group bacterium]|nr:tetratricopeptide repeat protein [Patescibacteria group bacterium]
YKSAGDRTLAYDLYRPASLPAGGKTPLVIFVNGVGDPPGAPLKDWGAYKDWARLVAVSGMAAVLHNTTQGKAAEDVADLIGALRGRAAELHLDPDNIALWSSSANVRVGFPFAMDPAHTFVKAAVFYYGAGMDPNMQRADLPVMIGRAGLDFPGANRSIDAWVARALVLNAPVTVENLPNGRHGFDAFDDHDASREVVRQTLAFLKENLSAGVQRGRTDRAVQARAISLSGAGRHAEAAQAYQIWVTQEPETGVAHQGLADALYQLKRYAEAARSFEKAGDLNVMPALTWYNAACSYALAGDKEKAITLLTRAIGTGFVQDLAAVRRDADLATLLDDPRFRKLVGDTSP